MSETKTFKRATLYYKSDLGMGYRAVKVRDLEVETGCSYAQYDNATRLTFVPKGKRKKRGYVETCFPSTVVVEGWDAPDYDVSAFKKTGPMTEQSRHMSHSPEWGREFDAWLKAKGLTVAVDLRGVNPYNRFRNAG